MTILFYFVNILCCMDDHEEISRMIINGFQ